MAEQSIQEKNKGEDKGKKAVVSNRRYVLMDANGQILGRLATRIASHLMGKGSVSFHPAKDMGDAVVVINAGKVRLTGKKGEEKRYSWHTGYPRGYREMTYEKLFRVAPEEVLTLAVKGMLPKNKTQKQRMGRLFIYADANHPHQAQKPVALHAS